MSSITPFQFENSSVRVHDDGGAPWFVLADVCRALDISNPSDAAVMVDDEDKSRLSLGSGKPAYIINESGLYTIILRSDKPKAKAFRKWVTSEVLPSIRKTGAYTAAKPELHPAESLAVCNQFLAFTMAALPNLGERSRQALIASTTEYVVGRALIPPPVVDEPFYTTGDIAKEAGVSPQLAGRRANAAGLKTPEYGEVRLSKASHSDKQVEQFYWNENGRASLLSILRGLQ